MRIFVAGGTGFIGSHLVKLALAMGHDVLCLRRSLSSSPRIALPQQPIWLDKPLANISSSDLEGIDLVVHLVAHNVQPPFDTLDACILHNVLHPLSLLGKAALAGVSNYVVAGSCFEYGLSGLRYDFIPPDAPLEPTLTYSASKAAASIAFTQWALQQNVSLSIKRIFHVYGAGESASRFYPSLIEAAQSGQDFPMTRGEQIRDFADVTFVASELLNECEWICSERRATVSWSNLGLGKAQSILSFAQDIWRIQQAKGQLLPGALPYREGEVMRYVPEVGTRHLLKIT